MQSLIDTVRKYSDAHKEKLVSVVIESNQGLKPLCDPLQAKAGLNRWLSRAREEAYSDWLAWIIEQLKPDQILTLFGISDSSFAESCKGVPKCSREIVIPNGRLDILIEFGPHARIVIEVKKTANKMRTSTSRKATPNGSTSGSSTQGVSAFLYFLLRMQAKHIAIPSQMIFGL